MEKEQILQQAIASNLIYYRKLANLTQLQLADKINYSDKAISKWERGEGVPDIYVLKQLADLYHITVNDLISQKKKKKSPSFLRNRVIVTLLSCVCVWLVAVVVFVIISWTPLESYFDTWLIYIYAIPVMFIVLIVFTSLWFKKIYRLISISGLIWTLLLAIYLSRFTQKYDGLIFIIGIPIQVGFILWMLMKKKKHYEIEEKNNTTVK